MSPLEAALVNVYERNPVMIIGFHEYKLCQLNLTIVQNIEFPGADVFLEPVDKTDGTNRGRNRSPLKAGSPVLEVGIVTELDSTSDTIFSFLITLRRRRPAHRQA